MHKIIKAECLGRGAYLEPHCFPEFAGDLSILPNAGPNDRNLFRRVDLGDASAGIMELAAERERQASRDAHPGDNEDDQEMLLKEMRQQILNQGIAQGEACGRESERRKIEPLQRNLCQSIEDLEQLRHRLSLQMEAETVRLALAIARKIVGLEAAVNSEMVLRVVRSALANVLDREKITIRLHPQDCQLVAEHRKSLGDGNENSGGDKDPARRNARSRGDV